MIDNNFIFTNFTNNESHNSLDSKLRENLQIYIISELASSNFYNDFAFTGGTCLRLMHGLNRYSEDLDFDAIDKKQKEYNFNNYFEPILDLIEGFGIEVELFEKKKNMQTSIKTFYFNFNYWNLLDVFNLSHYKENFQESQKLKIKFELQTDLYNGETFETIESDFPLYRTNTVDRTSMFANKLNAILYRNEAGQVKGRDFFDLKYYIENEVELNLPLFLDCLSKNGMTLNGKQIYPTLPKNKEELISLIKTKIKKINFGDVVDDIFPFVEKNFDFSKYNIKDFLKLVEKINVNFPTQEQDNFMDND